MADHQHEYDPYVWVDPFNVINMKDYMSELGYARVNEQSQDNSRKGNMELLGYRVYSFKCHGGIAFDFSAPNKGQMDSHHYKSEKDAWEGAISHYDNLVALSRRVMAIVNWR